MYKDLFWSLDENYVYLDNAASAPPFKEVVYAARDFLKTYGSIHRGSGRLSEISTAAYEDARKTIAKFIGAKPERDAVIFTANTTDAINRLSLIRPWRAVLVSDIEHSSNYLPWEGKTEVFTFEAPNYMITPEKVEESLERHPQIELIAVFGASNVTGYVTPIRQVYDVCKRHGAKLLIDASQLAPHYPLSLDDCDFVAFSGHKMYAPFGAGVLAGRKEVLQEVGMSATGGGNVVFIHPVYGPVYQDESLRHEAGTPNGIGAVAMAAAARVLEKVGFDAIKLHNKKVCEWFAEYLGGLPCVDLYFPQNLQYEHTPTAVFRVKGICAKDAAKELCRKNIGVRYGTFCEYRLAEKLLGIPGSIIDKTYEDLVLGRTSELPDEYGLIRASAGLMTEEKDVKRLASAIKEIAGEAQEWTLTKSTGL